MSPKHMLIRRGEFTGFRLPKLPHGRKDNQLPTHSNYRGDMHPTRTPRSKVRFKNYKTNDLRWSSGGDVGCKSYQDESGTIRLLIKIPQVTA